jgi:cobalt-zinc-cadmium efflux system outer membrane protein
VKVIWALTIVVGSGPAIALAQSAPIAGTPVAGADARAMPLVQPPPRAVVAAPEPVPLGPPQGGPGRPLTLADLEGIALAKNPTLTLAAARVGAARGEWTQAGLPPNPTGGYLASEIGDERRAGQQGGFVGQEFVTAGKLRLSHEVAAQAIRQAEQQFAAQRFRVLNDVRISFYDVLVAQRRIEVSQELAGVSERGLKAADSFFKAKEGSRVDLLQANIEANSAKVAVETARNEYLAAWRRLTAIVGTPEMQPTPLNGDLREAAPDISFDEAMQRLLGASPELAASQVGVARARAAVSRAQAERIPNIATQASVQYDNATGDTIAGVQVGVAIPLFNRNQGGERRAEADLAAAQSDYQRVQLDLQHRLATVYQQYASSRRQVEVYSKNIIPDAETALKLVTDGYQQGAYTYLILLTAQRTYYQTHLAYLEALKQLRSSSIEIDGMLLTGSLKAGDDSH